MICNEMYFGHYGIGLFLKKYSKGLSLGWLFLATQFVDFLAMSFLILEIEKANVVPGYSATSSMQYVYFPFSHSLIAFLIWTAVFYIIFRLIKIKSDLKKSKVALIMAGAVFSHFILDFIVHTNDMPIFFNGSYKLGLGLWNYSPILNYILEGSILMVGLLFYLRSTKAESLLGKYGIIVLVAIMLILNALLMSGLTLSDSFSSAIFYLFVNLSITLSAFWLDKKSLNDKF